MGGRRVLASDGADIRATTPAEDLHRLIRAEGLNQCGTFFVTGEGKRLPDGSENASGYVIDDQGRVFSFWLDWDQGHHRVALTEWEEVQPEPDWAESAEYREARTAAGLAAE